MGLAAVPPDWPPLRTAEVRRLLGRLPGVGDPSAASITWHSPRPFAATAVISVPGPAGHERRRFVAKRHHRAVRTAASLEAEHRFMRHLEAHGHRRPQGPGRRCLFSVDGGRVRLRGPGDARRARPLPGRVVVDALQVGGHGEAAGRALARLHLASQTYTAARPLELLRAAHDIISSADPVATAAALAERRPGLADFLRQRPWRQELSTSLGSLQARFLPYAGALAPLWAHNDWHPSNLLCQTGGLTHLGDGHCDVTAFGAVLEEILGGTDGPDDFCREIRALAMCCRDQAPEMRHVPIVLRLMALRARQSAMAPREPVRVRRPEPARLRLHLSLHWRPLANLAALALSGK